MSFSFVHSNLEIFNLCGEHAKTTKQNKQGDQIGRHEQLQMKACLCSWARQPHIYLIVQC